MRNSVDQADEQTSGANKKTLLLGERAMLVPDAGVGAAAPKAAPTSRRSVAPRPVVKETASAPKATQPPPVQRPTVEVIKGGKKEIQDFPQ
jgi:hypothetical protein